MSFDALVTLIILGVVLVLYATEVIPIALTAIVSMMAVYLTGILSFEQAFSGFSNTVFLMLIGMSVFGSAFAHTGILDIVVERLQRYFLSRKNFTEKKFVLISGFFGAVMSTILNPVLVTTIFMDIFDSMARKPGSGITRRNTVYPLSVASVYGATLTSISLSTLILSSAFLEKSSYGQPFRFFEPAVLGIPCLIAFMLYFGTIGYSLERKFFRFEEKPVANRGPVHSGDGVRDKRKMTITLVTLAVCMVLFIFSDYSIGAVAFGGAMVLFLTKCVDMPTAFREVNWSTAILLAASMGFANAVEISGAGAIIADWLIKLFGPLATTAVGICFLGLLISSIMSSFMANASTALILLPIFVIIAENCGAPLLPVVLAVGGGAGLAISTPICTCHITLTTSVGYRFKDYTLVGGLLNLITIVLCTGTLYVCYLL